MGTDNGHSHGDAKPVHEVVVRTFEMSRAPVTGEQYSECVNKGQCTRPGTGDSGYCNWGKKGRQRHLVETGSRMDEVIFEEFKGTGNSEVVLDRKLADRRMFPAVDINRSGTRKEELLLSEDEFNKVWILRKVLSSLGSVDAMQLLGDKLLATKSNKDFLKSMELSSME